MQQAQTGGSQAVIITYLYSNKSMADTPKQLRIRLWMFHLLPFLHAVLVEASNAAVVINNPKYQGISMRKLSYSIIWVGFAHATFFVATSQGWSLLL